MLETPKDYIIWTIKCLIAFPIIFVLGLLLEALFM